jgi:hypothetical protein
MGSLRLYGPLMKRFGLVKEAPSTEGVVAQPSG